MEKNLYAACTSGLGDRLLVLAGAQRIAALTGRQFRLHWRVNDRCGAPFRSLFESDIAETGEADVQRLLWTNAAVKFYNAWLDRPGPVYHRIAADGDPHMDIVVIKCWNYPLLETDRDDAALQAELRRRLLALQPSRRLRDETRAFAGDRRWFGVHIRRGDAVERFGQSAEEHFTALMEALLEREPEAGFFLATDVAAVEERLRSRFGSRVECFPKFGAGRARQRGMEESLIDLLLLARSRAIIGNVHSSFTRVAAMMGECPLVLAGAVTAGEQLADSMATLLSGEC